MQFRILVLDCTPYIYTLGCLWGTDLIYIIDGSTIEAREGKSY